MLKNNYAVYVGLSIFSYSGINKLKRSFLYNTIFNFKFYNISDKDITTV